MDNKEESALEHVDKVISKLNYKLINLNKEIDFWYKHKALIIETESNRPVILRLKQEEEQ